MQIAKLDLMSTIEDSSVMGFYLLYTVYTACLLFKPSTNQPVYFPKPLSPDAMLAKE